MATRPFIFLALLWHIQVTHNEKFAHYGKRIVRLEDGIIRKDVVNSIRGEALNVEC